MARGRILKAVLAGLCIAGFGLAPAARAAGPDERPGERFEVRPADLPPPYATDAVSNGSRYRCCPPDQAFHLPEGFHWNAFATSVTNARWLATAPNGDVFVAMSGPGRIGLLRDGDGDGVAETKSVFAEGFQRPHGLAVRPGYLYLADVERVWRIPYEPGDTVARAPAEPVTPEGALGAGSGHWTRNIAFAPDGARFYVAIGSRGNVGEEPAPRASVLSFAVDGSDRRSFATGLRNPVGIAFYPGADDLYVVVNERDGLGDGLVPDYLTRVEEGGFYGWPYSYIGAHPQPGLEGKRPDLVARAIVPDVLFESHSAPMGLVFYQENQFPESYRGDAFVAFRGSWNAARPTGYKIVRVPFEDGRPAGGYENFATGFWFEGRDRATVWGRPVGLTVAKDGALLIADDTSSTVWRIAYRP
ncbi:MAG: sorbosone dehydrogenase [Rhodospirillaceae bacterium]|nr:sorbosone dehydrogenase [Rhodospirillaceae bacterium]